MTRISRKLPIALVLSLVAGVGVAQADSKGTLIALRMPPHETRVRTNPLTQHPRELPARAAELSTGFSDERPIDIFSKRAIERVALHQPETDAVPAGVGNQIHFARKYPPKEFDLWAGLKFQYERYPMGQVDADHLGYPLRRNPLGAVLRPLE